MFLMVTIKKEEKEKKRGKKEKRKGERAEKLFIQL